MVSAVPVLAWVAALVVAGLWAFFGHVFVPEEAARAIGWPTSPFQREVGMANLGIGVAGVIAAFRGFDFRLAVAIVAACFLIGAGVGHIREIMETGNLAPGNAGPILFTDFLTPIAILGLLWLNGRAAEQGQ